MSRAERDLETLRACVTARMKSTSIAATLGRSLKWVEARIAEIEAGEQQGQGSQRAPSASTAGPPLESDLAGDGREADADVPQPLPDAADEGVQTARREGGFSWTPERLLVVRKASKLGLDLDEIAEIAGSPQEEIDRALNAMLGRSLEEAADELAVAVSQARSAKAAAKPEAQSKPDPLEGRPDLVTQAQFAKLRGVTPPVICRFIATGALSPVAVETIDGRKLIRRDIALAELEARAKAKAEASEARRVEQEQKAAAKAKPKLETTKAPGSVPLTGLVTKSCYAIHRGVSQGAVSHAIERGRIHGDALVQIGDEIRIDVQKADAQLAERPKRSRSSDAVETPAGSVDVLPATRADPGQAGGAPSRSQERAPLAPVSGPRHVAPPAYYNVAPRPSPGRSSSKGVPALAPPPPPAVRPLKPVNGLVARWTARYLARGVSLDLLAELFDRDRDELGRAAEAWA